MIYRHTDVVYEVDVLPLIRMEIICLIADDIRLLSRRLKKCNASRVVVACSAVIQQP